MKCKFLALMVIVALTTGCFSTPRAARSRLDLPHPAPLRMRPVRFHVLPQENATPNKQVPFIALTEDGYKNLAENFRDATNFIGLQRRIIDSYKRYYEPAER